MQSSSSNILFFMCADLQDPVTPDLDLDHQRSDTVIKTGLHEELHQSIVVPLNSHPRMKERGSRDMTVNPALSHHLRGADHLRRKNIWIPPRC